MASAQSILKWISPGLSVLTVPGVSRRVSIQLLEAERINAFASLIWVIPCSIELMVRKHRFF